MGSIFQGLWKTIINGVMQIVLWVWYMLQEVIGTVLDMLTQLFFIFSGMTPISGNGAGSVDLADGSAKKIDIIRLFTGNEVFQRAYLDLALVALGLVVVFTIAKIIKQDYFEKAGPRSKGPIFRDMILSFIAFLCIVPLFSFVIQAAGALAVLVMDAMGYEGGGVGTMLFEMSWADGGSSIRTLAEAYGENSYNKDIMNWYPDDVFYYYFWDSEHAMLTHDMIGQVREVTAHGVTVQFMREEYYWYIFVFAGAILCKTFLEMVTAMVSRLFKLIALFVVSPSPISQIVLDGGTKFKQWKDMFLQEALKVVGVILCFMTFVMIAGMVNDIDLMKFAFTDDAASSAKNLLESNALTAELNNEVDVLYYGKASEAGPIDNLMNALGKAVILIAGMGAIKDMDGVITPLLAGGKSSLDAGATGKVLEAAGSTAVRGALGITKAGITGAVGLAGGAVRMAGGIASGIAAKTAGAVEKVKQNNLDHENAKLEKEAQENAPAPDTSTPETANTTEDAVPAPETDVPENVSDDEAKPVEEAALAETEKAEENSENDAGKDERSADEVKNDALNGMQEIYDKYGAGQEEASLDKDGTSNGDAYSALKDKMTDEDRAEVERLEKEFEAADVSADRAGDGGDETEAPAQETPVTEPTDSGAEETASPAESAPVENVEQTTGDSDKQETPKEDNGNGGEQPQNSGNGQGSPESNGGKQSTAKTAQKIVNKNKQIAEKRANKEAKKAKKAEIKKQKELNKKASDVRHGFRQAGAVLGVLAAPLAGAVTGGAAGVGKMLATTAKTGLSTLGIVAKTAAGLVGWEVVANSVEGVVKDGADAVVNTFNETKDGLKEQIGKQWGDVSSSKQQTQQMSENNAKLAQDIVDGNLPPRAPTSGGSEAENSASGDNQTGAPRRGLFAGMKQVMQERKETRQEKKAEKEMLNESAKNLSEAVNSKDYDSVAHASEALSQDTDSVANAVKVSEESGNVLSNATQVAATQMSRSENYEELSSKINSARSYVDKAHANRDQAKQAVSDQKKEIAQRKIELKAAEMLGDKEATAGLKSQIEKDEKELETRQAAYEKSERACGKWEKELESRESKATVRDKYEMAKEAYDKEASKGAKADKKKMKELGKELTSAGKALSDEKNKAYTGMREAESRTQMIDNSKKLAEEAEESKKANEAARERNKPGSSEKAGWQQRRLDKAQTAHAEAMEKYESAIASGDDGKIAEAEREVKKTSSELAKATKICDNQTQRKNDKSQRREDRKAAHNARVETHNAGFEKEINELQGSIDQAGNNGAYGSGKSQIKALTEKLGNARQQGKRVISPIDRIKMRGAIARNQAAAEKRGRINATRQKMGLAPIVDVQVNKSGATPTPQSQAVAGTLDNNSKPAQTAGDSGSSGGGEAQEETVTTTLEAESEAEEEEVNETSSPETVANPTTTSGKLPGPKKVKLQVNVIEKAMGNANKARRKNKGVEEARAKVDQAVADLPNCGEAFDLKQLEGLVSKKPVQFRSKKNLKNMGLTKNEFVSLRRSQTMEKIREEYKNLQDKYDRAVDTIVNAVGDFDPKNGYSVATANAIKEAQTAFEECAADYAKLQKKAKGKE